MDTSRDRERAPRGTMAHALAMLVALAAMLVLSGDGAWAEANQPAIRFVDDSAMGANDGTSWADAFTDLQDALDVAVSGDQIWVAAGTYTPSRNLNPSYPRRVAFALKSGVAIYGGFMGSETALGERSSDPGLTVLSGDIGTPNDDSDNSYNVVYADGVTNAVLDGVTVTLGRADGEYGRNDSGGGMVVKNSLLTVSNCVFSDNKARYSGGGLYCKESALTVTDSVFSDNEAGVLYQDNGQGGGMYNEGEYTDLESPVPYRSPVIRGCKFTDNRTFSTDSLGEVHGGGGGGGMYTWAGRPTVERCTFERNRAWGTGSKGGGIFNWLGEPTVSNCVFNGNVASYGGGGVANLGTAIILNSTFYRNGRASPQQWPVPHLGGAIFQKLGGTRIVDVIFSGNAATHSGGGVYAALAGPAYLTITRCLFHENYGNYDHEISHVWHSETSRAEVSESLFDVDPLLADPANGDFHLLAGSPAIDAGVTRKYADMTWLPLPATDFEGDKRVIDGDGFGGGRADIGADEYVPTLDELRALIEELLASYQIDGGLAIVLLDFVDDAQGALDSEDPDSAKSILEQMIDWLKAMEDTGTRELILRKAEAVHGTFD